MAGARVAAVALALIGYAVLSYGLMAYWPDRPWTVAVLFGPLLGGMAIGGISKRHVPTLLGCAALTAVLVAVVLRGGVSVNLMYVLQHAAIHLLLAATFAATLRPGQQPLITQIARRLHTRFDEVHQARYTRRLTATWAGYFIGMVVVSVLLYAGASWTVWSFFCNIVTPAAAIALFAGEHVLRYWWHPEFERLSMHQVMRAYRNHGTTT